MQDIIVVLIGIVVFGYVGWKIYKIITRKPGVNNTCGGCTGCALKENMECSIQKTIKDIS
jgi:hypothetical protein